jgi:hypothetical protein
MLYRHTRISEVLFSWILTHGENQLLKLMIERYNLNGMIPWNG